MTLRNLFSHPLVRSILPPITRAGYPNVPCGQCSSSVMLVDQSREFFGGTAVQTVDARNGVPLVAFGRYIGKRECLRAGASLGHGNRHKAATGRTTRGSRSWDTWENWIALWALSCDWRAKIDQPKLKKRAQSWQWQCEKHPDYFKACESPDGRENGRSAQVPTTSMKLAKGRSADVLESPVIPGSH